MPFCTTRPRTTLHCAWRHVARVKDLVLYIHSVGGRGATRCVASRESRCARPKTSRPRPWPASPSAGKHVLMRNLARVHLCGSLRAVGCLCVCVCTCDCVSVQVHMSLCVVCLSTCACSRPSALVVGMSVWIWLCIQGCVPHAFCNIYMCERFAHRSWRPLLGQQHCRHSSVQPKHVATKNCQVFESNPSRLFSLRGETHLDRGRPSNF